MKIKVVDADYERVMKLPLPSHRLPIKPSIAVRRLLKTVSDGELKKVNFKNRLIGMEKLKDDVPALILMNHSSFIDLKIAESIFYPRPLSIICTSDGFVGKYNIMRALGCVPTQKFVTDLTLVKDIAYCLKVIGTSVLMYPEASYTFDGKATPLPQSLGKLVKMLGVPVVTVTTFGAFQRDPLYNGLQLRAVDVSAKTEYILSPGEIKELNPDQINEKLAAVFSFDNFRWQKDNGVIVKEDFRADMLNRVLYKCPHCLTEGNMKGRGITLTCENCGAEYELTELGELKAKNVEAKFKHIPDWYAWERSEVKKEILSDKYSLNVEVDIIIMRDYHALYRVGSGVLTHNSTGFILKGCDGKLSYTQTPAANYGLYADYFWYEQGDVICIGDKNALYYCLPKNGGDVVAKTRLAAEELFKLKK